MFIRPDFRRAVLWGNGFMKKIACVLFILSLTLAFGCGKTDSGNDSPQKTESSMSSRETFPLTLPLDPEVSQSLYEASISEEESLNEESARWDAVDEVMAEVFHSKEFTEAETDEQKAEIIINAMKELSEHGTEKYPESLIIYGSWEYYPDYQEVNAKYFDGVEFGVSWYDYNAASTAYPDE